MIQQSQGCGDESVCAAGTLPLYGVSQRYIGRQSTAAKYRRTPKPRTQNRSALAGTGYLILHLMHFSRRFEKMIENDDRDSLGVFFYCDFSCHK